MKMKKLFCTLFAAVGLALVGCGNNAPALRTTKQVMVDVMSAVAVEFMGKEAGYTAQEDVDFYAADEDLGITNGWYSVLNFGTQVANENYFVPVLTAIADVFPEYATEVLEPTLFGSGTASAYGMVGYSAESETVGIAAQATVSNSCLMVMIIVGPADAE